MVLCTRTIIYKHTKEWKHLFSYTYIHTQTYVHTMSLTSIALCIRMEENRITGTNTHPDQILRQTIRYDVKLLFNKDNSEKAGKEVPQQAA